MSVSVRLFWILAAFFFLLSGIYTLWSVLEYNARDGSTMQPTQPIEWVGTIALALSGILAVLIAFFLARAHSSQGGELAEDRIDADIDDGDAEVGFYSPWSWWPMTLGVGAALVFLGIAVGFWISLIGLPIALIAIVGWVYEYYRLNFAR